MDKFFTEHETTSDSLTGVYAQKTLASYADYLISENTPFSFALLDVDNFSYINDAFGRDGGDKVLCDIASTVSAIVGDKGIIARNRGDEFSIILKNIVTYDEIWNICHTILVKVNEIELPEIGNQTLTVTIGLVRYPENAENFEDLLSCAEKALYRGKTKGRNCFIIYLPEKHANIVPKNEKQQAVGSLNIHSNIFKYLTSPDELRLGITNLFNFFSSYFEIDHICIQTEKGIHFQKIHQLSQNAKFEHVPHDLIKASINRLTGVLYVSDTKNLLKAKHEKLYEIFERQEISASCFCEISYRGKIYGMLRIDMTNHDNSTRLLQYSDMDLFLTAAKTIALILNYSGKSIEDL